MKTSLTVILSALGVAALLASPVAATTVRHYKTAPSTAYVPPNAYGAAIGAYRTPGATPEGGAYTPSMPAPPGKNLDFQAGRP